MKVLQKFIGDEDGAITVDFVVLTAAICLIGVVVIFTFSGEFGRLSIFISTFMGDQCANGPCN